MYVYDCRIQNMFFNQNKLFNQQKVLKLTTIIKLLIKKNT